MKLVHTAEHFSNIFKKYWFFSVCHSWACEGGSWFLLLMYFTAVHDTAAISVRCRSECDVGFRDGILQIIEVPALGSFMQKLEVCLVLTQCVKVRRTDLAWLFEDFGQENRNGSGLLGSKLTDVGKRQLVMNPFVQLADHSNLWVQSLECTTNQ